MVLIPAGTFTMGAKDNEGSTPRNATPQHEVTLTHSFYLGVFEVTNEQYDKVMRTKPLRNENAKVDNLPADTMNWEQAVQFCEKLSELPEEKLAGRTYRLPTEAEWEYACRAGSTTLYSFGDSPKDLGDYAWFESNIRDGKTAPAARRVGLKKPNAWGLYDMHGNLAEFCHDVFSDYPKGPVTDPRGPKDGYNRVVRGGYWGGLADQCRCAYRNELGGASNTIGFRVAMSLPHQMKPNKAVQEVLLSEFDLSNQLDHQPRGSQLLPRRLLDYKALKESYWHVAAFMADGADPNSKSENGTPILFHAIDFSEIEIKNLLSNWEVEAHLRSIRKQPALPRPQLLVAKNLEAILAAGADPNLCDQDGQSPLHFAIKNQRTSAVESLMKFGADPNKPDVSGLSAIEYAKERNVGASLLAELTSDRNNIERPARIPPPRVIRTPDQQLGSTFFRAMGGGASIVYSADGKHLVTGETEHAIRVFDAATGQRQSVINTRFNYVSNNYIWSLAAIPKSPIVIASGGIGYPLRFWDIETSTEVLRLQCNSNHASVSPNGKFLFTGDYLCQIESTNPIKLSGNAREYRGKNAQKIDVRFSFFTPDNNYLILVDREKVWAWRLSDDEVVSLADSDGNSLSEIASADLAKAFKNTTGNQSNDILAMVATPQFARQFKPGDPQVLKANKQLLQELFQKTEYRAFAFSPDNRFLAARGVASCIDIFDLQNFGKRITYDGHTDALLAVALSPDGKWIASGGIDKQVIVWDRSTSKAFRTISLKSVVLSLKFSGDSKQLAIGDAGSNVHMHDLAVNKTQVWKARGRVTGLLFDDKQNSLVVLSEDLQLWDARTGKVLSTLPAGNAKFGKIASSTSGLILGSANHQLDESRTRNVWSIQGKNLVPKAELFGDTDNKAYPLATNVFAISRDGRKAAAASNWEIRVWDFDKREPFSRPFVGMTCNVTDIEFSHDGRYLSAGCDDGMVRLWDVATARQLLIMDADVGRIADIDFSDENGSLATANGDGTVHVWNITNHLTDGL